MCDPDTYIYNLNMKVEDNIVGDDSAANGFQFQCRDLNDKNLNDHVVNNAGPWGYWRGWKEIYPEEFLCGGKARSERPQGSSDDSALNGFTMETCSLSKRENK